MALSDRTIKYYQDLIDDNPERERAALVEGIKHFHEKGNKTQFYPTVNKLEYEGRKRLDVQETQSADKTGRTLSGTIKDIGITAAKSVIGTGEAAVGLADIPTLGRAGRFMQENLGYDPKKTHEILDSNYSPAQKEANRKFSEADGIGGKLSAAIHNPSIIGHAVVESLPLMGAGAAIGRGISALASKAVPWVAAAIGEGIVGAGSAAEQTRQQTKDKALTFGQSAISIASGVGTTVFGLAGGRLAKKFGFDDADTLLVGGKASVAKEAGEKFAISAKDVAKRIIKGGISEGVFEELPQSIQEQIWSNAAIGQPLMNGVDEAAVMGLLTGGVMGAGANALTSGARSLDDKDDKSGPSEAEKMLMDEKDLGKSAEEFLKEDITNQEDDVRAASEFTDEELDQAIGAKAQEETVTPGQTTEKNSENIDKLSTPGQTKEQAETGLAPSLEDKDQQAFIDEKVKELGSIEAVNKAYPKDDSVSEYARAKAMEVFGKEVEQTEKTERTAIKHSDKDVAELWKSKPSDLENLWDDGMSHVDEVRNKNAPEIESLSKQLAELKGKKGKDVVQKRKELSNRIAELEGDAGQLEASYEEYLLSHQAKLEDEALSKARTAGLKEEDEEDFVTLFNEEIESTRPQIERNYDKSIDQIYNEVLSEFETETTPNNFTDKPIRAFHGTHSKKVDTFDRNFALKNKKLQGEQSLDLIGSWFTDKTETARELYGPNVIEADINFSKPLLFNGEGAFKQMQTAVKNEGGAVSFRENMIKEGYDGVVISGDKIDGIKQDIYIALEGKQISQVGKAIENGDLQNENKNLQETQQPEDTKDIDTSKIENGDLQPGQAVTWKTKKGEEVSATLVRKDKGDRWYVEKSDGIKTFISEKSLTLAEAPSTEAKETFNMSRKEYVKTDEDNVRYDRMIWRAYSNDEISKDFLDKNTITNSVGEKYIWAKTRKEIEEEHKKSVKNARGKRAEENKNPLYGVKWANESNSKSNKKNIEDIKAYNKRVLESHSDIIEEALSEGKPVPENVLKEYPELSQSHKDSSKIEPKSRKDMTPEETKAIDDYVNSMIDHEIKGGKERGHAEPTQEQIDSYKALLVTRTQEFVDAIKNKSFGTLKERLHRGNKKTLKLFSALTGLSTKTQKITDENIRSLDPVKYDEWIASKKSATETADKEKAAARKEKKEKDMLEAKVKYLGETMTFEKYINTLLESGYTNIEKKEKGPFQTLKLLKHENNGKGRTFSTETFKKKIEIEYIERMFDKYSEKSIADDIDKEEKEKAENPDAFISKEDEDHLFGENKDESIGKNAAGQKIFQDKNGVRSYETEPGYLSTQPVSIVPGGESNFDSPKTLFIKRKLEYLTDEEIKGFIFPEEKQKLPEGWTEAKPGGLATSQDPVTGGIVDSEIKSGKWFAVPNNKNISTLEGFETREEALAALIEKTKKSPSNKELTERQFLAGDKVRYKKGFNKDTQTIKKITNNGMVILESTPTEYHPEEFVKVLTQKDVKIDDHVIAIKDKDIFGKEPLVVKHVSSAGIKVETLDGKSKGGHYSFDNFEKVEKPKKEKSKSEFKKLTKIGKLIDFFTRQLRSGKSFQNIIQARKAISEETGMEIVAGTLNSKIVDEAIEVAGVNAARAIIDGGRKYNGTSEDIFDKLVKLQERIPNLSVRTSTSVRDQAYSTPLPLAWLASELAGINVNTTVYESSAGNGALVIGANPENVTVNELNPERYENLLTMGFSVVSNSDGTVYVSIPKDVVISNPPFGAVKDDNGVSKTWKINDQYTTTQIDHAMVFKALESMKPGGRAVFIVGSVNDRNTDPLERKLMYRAKNKVSFYKTLFDNYNVVDHFSIAGKLYSQQGAAWPVDVIVIDGKGKSKRALPGAVAPDYLSTIEELKGKLNEKVHSVDNARNGKSGTKSSSDQVLPGTEGSNPNGDNTSVSPVGQNTGTDQRGPGPETGSKEPGGKTLGSGDTGRDDVSVSGDSSVRTPVGKRPVSGLPGVPGNNSTDETNNKNKPDSGSDTGRREGNGVDSVSGQSDNSLESELANTSEADLDAMLDEAFGEDITLPTDIQAELKGMSESDIDNLLDEVFDKPKPQKPGKKPLSPSDKMRIENQKAMERSPLARRILNQKAINRWVRDQERKNKPPKPPKGPKDLVDDLALESLSGVKNAIKGLGALFTPKNTLSSGFIFNEETYAAAKPYFIEAWNSAKKVGHTLKQLIQHLAQQFGAEIKPYLKRFFIDQSKEDKKPPEQKKPEPLSDTDTHVAYHPSSDSGAIGTLTPLNLADASEKALAAIVKKHGKIDDFVADRLGYTLEDIKGKDGEFGYFSGEQVDAIALAIDNIDKGAGFIIGDQTGVGKGRVVAAMLRFAIKNDLTPIFVTDKPNLYADMYRDFSDIGMADIWDKILVTNANLKIPMEGKNSKIIKTKANHNQELTKIVNSGVGLPSQYQVIFTTYDQMSETGSPRRAFIEAMAANNGMLIMDESHKAGGSGMKETATKLPREIWIRRVIDSAHSVFYSSATYAKRPDVMDLYRRTDMRLAVDNIDDLGTVINSGGVPLQQAVAAMLVRAGQYIRRERSFFGVSYGVKGIPVDHRVATDMSVTFKKIFDFSEAFIKAAIDDIGDTGAAGGVGVHGGTAAAQAKISAKGFSSVMHNIIGQSLLALKVDAAVDEAIRSHKEGRKPIIALANTMGSFVKEYAEENGLKPGDGMGLKFNDLLFRYLNKTRSYTVKQPYTSGPGTPHYISDAELGPAGVAAFNEVKRFIFNLDLENVPVSPIDHALMRLREAGIRVAEITGRNHTIEYRPDGSQRYRMRSGTDKSIAAKLATIDDFNKDNLDSLIVNQSASTGLSLHAIPKWEGHDPAQREMILLQAEANIDTHMQMLGRVHRAGQVKPPIYTQLMGDLPTEKRPAAVLLGKMASLNANTTAAKDSDMTAKDVMDFMNKYGDKVVAGLMADFPEIHSALGDPLGHSDSSESGMEEEGAAKKITGRVAMLPTIKQQEEIYSMIESGYKDLIQQLDATGQNDLEAKTFDTDAKTLEKATVFEGSDQGSPFTESAFAEIVDMKKLGKSFSSDEVQTALKEAIFGFNTRTARDTEKTLEEISSEGASTHHEKRADLLDSFNVYEHGMLDDIEKEERRRAVASRLTAVKSDWTRIFDRVIPGTVLEIPINGIYFDTVVLSVEQNGNPNNPLALGTWKATVAVPDSIKRIVVPFSFINRMESFRNKGSITPSKLARFDRASQVARETRTIMTGNLLAAYSRYPRGRIINYSNDKGVVNQGVLMPVDFDLNAAAAERPVLINKVEDAVTLLHAGIFIKATKGDLSITPKPTQFTISVPASRASGSKYFLNTGLIDAVGGDFVKAGNRMKKTIPMSDVTKVLRYLIEGMGEPFSNAADSNRVRQLLGIELPSFEPVANRNNAETPMPESEGNRPVNQSGKQNYRVTDRGKRLVQGAKSIKIEGYENIDFFVYKNEDDKWSIIEERTGLKAGEGDTQKAAKDKVKNDLARLYPTEKDFIEALDKMPQAADMPDQDVKFQTSDDIAPGQGVSLKNIQARFKGQHVFVSKQGSISIVFRNGKGIRILSTKAMPDGTVKYALESGRMSDKGTILGATIKDTMYLNPDYADTGTVDHEIWHILKGMGMVNSIDALNLLREFKKLKVKDGLDFNPSTVVDEKLTDDQNKAIQREENEANTFSQILKNREQYRNTPLGKLIQKIMDFLDGIVHIGRQSVRKLAQSVESGKIFGRESKGTQAQTFVPAYEKAADQWYSALTKIVDNIQQKAMPARQWQDLIESNKFKQSGVKAEEIYWSGIIPWINRHPGRVTKQDVLNYLAENNVKVVEIVKSDPTEDDIDTFLNDEAGEGFYREEARRHLQQDEDSTKFSQWLTPWKASDVENYKEIMLMLADKFNREALNQEYSKLSGDFADLEVKGRKALASLGKDSKEFNDFSDQQGEINKRRKQIRDDIAHAKRASYKTPSAHAYRDSDSDSNRIVMMRIGEKVIPSRQASKFDADYQAWIDKDKVGSKPDISQYGKNSIAMHVFEIQSDWSAEGREKGFKDPDKIAEMKDRLSGFQKERKKEIGIQRVRRHLLNDKIRDDYEFNVSFEKSNDLQDKIDVLIDQLNEKQFKQMEAIQPGPFVNNVGNYVMLAMKKLVRMAVENGYDLMIFDTGKIHADRYNLSKQISKINYTKDTKWLTAFDKTGARVISLQLNNDSELEHNIGKEAAKRLLEAPVIELKNTGVAGIGPKGHMLEGEDLNIGGEGLKRLYDVIIPAEINKFFNKKAWGYAKVELNGIEVDQPGLGTRSYEGPVISIEQVSEDAVFSTLNENLINQLGSIKRAMEGGLAFEDAMMEYGSVALADHYGGKLVTPYNTAKLHVLRITPEMKSKALREGMPLFQTKEPTNILSKASLESSIVRNDKLYTLMLDEIESGPLDGGCYVLAKALQNTIGGELYTIYDGSKGEHIVLKKDNTYWDGDGKQTIGELKKTWETKEGLSDFKIKPFKKGDVSEASRSSSLIVKVEKHLTNATNPDIKFQTSEDLKKEPSKIKSRFDGNDSGYESDQFKDILPKAVAKAMQQGRGIKKDTLLDKFNSFKTDMKMEMDHFPDLTRMEPGAQRSSAREILRRHQDISNIVQDKAARKMSEMLRDLNKQEYDMFAMELILGDEVRSINDGLRTEENLPWGFETMDQIIESHKKIQNVNRKNERVANALEDRRKFHKGLARDLVNLGIMKKEILKSGDYFHHQILLYWNEKAEEHNRGMGTSSSEVRTKWRPWMTARKGSPLDYNTEYMEAEFIATSQQMAMIETAKNLAQIKKENDILKSLKQEAKAANKATYEKWVALQQKNDLSFEDPAKPHVIKIAMGFSGLAQAVKTGKITYDSEFQDVINAIQKAEENQKADKAAWKEAIDDNPNVSLVIDHPRLFPFLSHLIEKQHQGSMYAAMIYKGIKGRDRVVKEVLGKHFKTWKQIIPKGYKEWKPDPNKGAFFVNSVTDQVLQNVLAGEKTLEDKDVRKVLARGYPPVWVLPEGLADTMDNFRLHNAEGRLSRLSEKAMAAWKQYILLNPFSAIKYNINNMSGDLDIVLAYRPEIANPKALKKSLGDLINWSRYKKLSPQLKTELEEAQKHGVIGSGFAVQEVTDTMKIMTTTAFVKDILTEEKLGLTASYWKHVKNASQTRENILRLAAFRWFKKQLESGESVYGASNVDDINNLVEQNKITEAAAKLSRELLGDYGNISRHGEFIRRRMIPFYSWIEINAPRYAYLMRNLKHEGETINRLGFVFAKRSLVFAVKVSMLAGAVMLFNATMFPDELEDLGPEKRRQMHLILGRREDGSIITLRFQGALSDALSWFAKEDLPSDIKDLMQGKSTIQEQLMDIPKAVLNKTVNSIRPDVKMLFETLTGSSTYPDATSPKPIRDKVENILKTFKLDVFYRAAMGRPGRGKDMAEHFLNDLLTLVTYTSEPGVQAYYDTRKLVFEWKEKNGFESGGGKPTKKGNAFYYYRQALKYGDLVAAKKYLQKYYDLGGTAKGEKSAISLAHPLAGIKKTDRYEFKKTLLPAEKKRLEYAIKWYTQTYVEKGREVSK